MNRLAHGARLRTTRFIFSTALSCALVVPGIVPCASGVAHAQERGAGGASPAPQGQDRAGVDEGRTRFTRGIELYKEGNFHAALAEFRAAYAAAPSFRFHYNLGQTLYQLQDYAGAVRSFEQYLSEGRDKIDPDRKKEVESDLAKLRPRFAKLVVVTNVPTAEVSIDDEPQGKVRSEPVLVSAGRRRIAVTASGYQTETRVLDVAGAQQLDLTFELKPLNGSDRGERADDGRADSESAHPRHKSRTPFYIGLAATGVLGGATVAMAILASSKHSDFENSLSVPNNKTATDDARSASRTTSLVADVFGGATLVAAGLTVVAYVMTSGNEPTPMAKVAPPKPKVRAVVGPSAVGVTGTF